jgi:radical SAM protein with 4Fe4S-binding SPASM domain
MQIKCDFYNYRAHQWHQYEIDLDLNVYPCCHYYTDYMEFGKINERISHIDNNLKTNSLNHIFSEYDKVLNEKIWKNEKTCPPLCMKVCQKK